MCGIVGGVTNSNITPLLLEGLNRLEYRGYDSSGLIVLSEKNTFNRARSVGKVKNLEKNLNERINKIKGKGGITVHDELRVSFKKTNPDRFEEKRQEYHKAIQEDFFNNYDIRKLTIRSVEKGETLWEICNDIYTIPLWLLSSYNSEKNINSLAVGEPIVIPIISPKTG